MEKTQQQAYDFMGKKLTRVGDAVNDTDGVNKGQLASYQAVSGKDIAGGFAGLNASSRIIKGVDATDDIIIDLATKGLVLKDTQTTPHYWRVTVSNAGALVVTDLGMYKP